MKKKLLVFDYNKNPTEQTYKKLGKAEKEAVDKFEQYCLITANKDRAKKQRSNAIRFIAMAQKPIKEIGIEDLREFLVVLKDSDFGDYYKNDVKGFVQRFLKWYFKDWSERFDNFVDIKYNSDANRKKEIKPTDVLSPQNVAELIKKETSIFWKAFIVCQYQSALRTKEARYLTWDRINTKDEDVYWLTIISKKNKNGTPKKRIAPPIDHEGIYWIEELRKWQKDNGRESPYLFPSKEDTNKPISSGAVSKWFSRLTKKVFGKPHKSYLLRHSKGEEFHKAIRAGTLSKENALQMMGHSEKMFDKTYSHRDNEEMKKVIKKQMLNLDYIPPERKNELEKKIEKLEIEKTIQLITQEYKNGLLMDLIEQKITRDQLDSMMKEFNKKIAEKGEEAFAKEVLGNALDNKEEFIKHLEKNLKK